MLFVTNRVPSGENPLVSEANRQLQFKDDFVHATNSLFYCRADANGEITEVMSDGFFASLAERGKMGRKNVLLYIHGYNTSMSKALGKGFSLQTLLDRIADKRFEVVTLIWPCTADPQNAEQQVRALKYWNDQDAADMSGPVFGRLLSRFVFRQAHLPANAEACQMRIHMLAHSMGNRVLMNVLNAWGNSIGGGGVPLLCRNIFLTGADIPNTALERGQPGYAITLAARKVIVYHASDDRKLEESIVANTFRDGFRGAIEMTARLGDSGPESLRKTRDNVHAIDCDQFNEQFDTKTEGGKSRSVGHSYFLTDSEEAEENPSVAWKAYYQVKGAISPSLYHMAATMLTDRVAKIGTKRKLKLSPDYIFPPRPSAPPTGTAQPSATAGATNPVAHASPPG